MSLASVIVFFIADRILSVSYYSSAIPYWNSGVRLFFYLAVSYFIAKQQKAEKQLSQSEERFRLLVEGAGNYSILMLDRNGSIISWNAGAEEYLDINRKKSLDGVFPVFILTRMLRRRSLMKI
jgi:PAS domain-containing protein